MRKFACVISALMLVGTPAVAQSDQTQTPGAKEIPSSDPSDVNRVVCRKEEQIGSRLGAKKLCMTVKDWQERAQFSREETERVQQGTPMRPAG